MNVNAPVPETLLVGEDEAVFPAKAFHALEVELYPVADVEGRARRAAGLRRLFEEALESPARIFAPDHKPDAEGPGVHDLPVARTNQARTSRTRRAPIGWRAIHGPLPDRYTAALAPP